MRWCEALGKLSTAVWFEQRAQSMLRGSHSVVDGGVILGVVPMLVLQNVPPSQVIIILAVLGNVHAVLALYSISLVCLVPGPMED